MATAVYRGRKATNNNYINHSAIIAVVLCFAHLSKMFKDELIVLAGLPRPWLYVVRSVLTSSPRKTLS